MTRVSQRWRGVALLPAAAMAVHQLRYLLAYGGGADQALSEQGHAYLSSMTPWVVFLCAAALGAFLGRLARAWRLGEAEEHSAASPLVVWVAAAAGLIALYTGQELLEGLLASGHPPGLIGVFGDGGWWALPAALFVGGVAHACVAGSTSRDALRCGSQGEGARTGSARTVRSPRPRDLAPRSAGADGRGRAGSRPAASSLELISLPRPLVAVGSIHTEKGTNMPRLARGLLLAIVTLASLPAIAGAHPGNPDFRSVIQGFSPQIPGVNVQVLNWDSDMQLSDPGHHTVVVYGYDHDQYARILPNGTVQVNQRSPAAYLNEDRYGTTPVPSSANPKAPPQWKTVNESGTFVWHDHRMHYMSPSTPPQVKDKGQRTKIFDYTIPLSVDGKPGQPRRDPLLGRPAQHVEDPVSDRRRGDRDRAADHGDLGPPSETG